MTKDNHTEFYEEYVKSALQFNDAERRITLVGGDRYHFILPLTYITPNYFNIFNFSIVSALSNLGHDVSILLHDNNLLSHPRYRNEMLARGNFSLTGVIENIIDEIELLLLALSANMEKIKIIKSSDMWGALSQDKLRFFSFYSLLGYLKFNKSEKDSEIFYNTAYHAIQRPFDVYFSKNFSALSKIDIHNPDFMIVASERLAHYKYIKARIHANLETTTSHGSEPIFVTTKPAYSFIYADAMPSANMNVYEIKSIIDYSKPSQAELLLTYENIIIPLARFLNAISLTEKPLAMPKRPKSYDVAISLYELITAVWNKAHVYSPSINKDIYPVTKSDFDKLIEILSSKAILYTLAHCDGKLTGSDISRLLGKQISNISKYLKMLREAGLITSEKKPRVRFKRIVIDTSVLGINPEVNHINK